MLPPQTMPLPANLEEFSPDPHKGYAKYRPISRLISLEPQTSMPVFTRYADVESLMTDKRMAQLETQILEMHEINDGPLHKFYANSMLTSNAPAHAQRRRPVARAFAFKLIQTWRPRIRELVTMLIEQCLDNQEFNLLTEISSPLPSYIIAEILGAPKEDATYFSSKVYEMSRGLGTFNSEILPGIEQATTDLYDYVAKLIATRRKDPQDDFLTDYINVIDETGELNEEEILSQIVALIIGGSDTTRFAFTALVYYLLQHRDQWEAVCNDPELAPGAVVEAIRYEPSVGSISRVVVEPIEIDGYTLRPGSVASISFLSAQRDEEVFSDPQQFNIHRQDHPRWSLSFGGGVHRCLGEALAKAELEEALIALSQRLPQLKMVGDPPQFLGNFGIRGVTPMHVSW